VAVRAQSMQPNDGSVRLRPGFNFNGFQHAR
jgi:hypothetical protein